MPKSDWDEVSKLINQIGTGTLPKSSPKQPIKPTGPQVIKERKDPQLIRDDPLPQPISERPTPRAVGDALGPTPANKVTPPPPDAQLIQLVKLYQQLGERDRRELYLIAIMKAQLSKKSDV